MGVYYTCDFCGTQGKGEYFCKCHAKESKRVQKVRKNSTIVDQVILHEPEGFLLFEKLVKNDVTCCDEVFYTLFLNGKFTFSSYEAFAEAKRQNRKVKSFSKCKCKPFVMCIGCASRATTFEIKAETPVETASGDACKRCEKRDQACVQHGGDPSTPVSSPRVERTSDGRTAADLDAEMDEYNSHPEGCKCYESIDEKTEQVRRIFDRDFLSFSETLNPEIATLARRIAKVAISEVEKQYQQNIIMSTADIEYFLDLWLEDEEADKEIISEKDFETICKFIGTSLNGLGYAYRAEDWSCYERLVRDEGKISYCENNYSTSIRETEECIKEISHTLGSNAKQPWRQIFVDTEFPVDQKTGMYINPLHYFRKNGAWDTLKNPKSLV